MNTDFMMETKLAKDAPELHRIFTDNVTCCQNMLIKYHSYFPTYTDHTALHSLEVIAFCNELIGPSIDTFNTDEIFVLLMAAYLHDTGMGITEEDYRCLVGRIPEAVRLISERPDTQLPDIIRDFHHEFSGELIKKYSFLFDFPSDKHLQAVIQVSRGHRKTDLYDATEYPSEISLDNGNVIHLPYITALMRLADELDISVERNLQFLYDGIEISNPKSVIEFEKHRAIKSVTCRDEDFLARVDYSNPLLAAELDEMFTKLRKTLDYCVGVTADRTPFRIRQKRITVEKI